MAVVRAGHLLESTPRHPTMSLSDLCEDVILLICDYLEHMRQKQETPLKHLSLINHRFRSLLTPHLFKTLHINRPASQLEPTHLTDYHALTFKIDMFGSMWWWCSGSYTSSSDAVELLRCIQDMKRLKTLEISMMRRSIDIYTAAFEDERVNDDSIFILDKVDKLVVTSSAAFLTSHCPNLKTLVIRDGSDCFLETYTDLMKRLAPLHPRLVGKTPQLTSFDATAVWSADELGKLVEAFPELQCLKMRSDTFCYRASTAVILETLGKGLANLRTLHLVKSGSLGMGYQSVWKRKIQACSDDEYRRLLWLENERLRVRVENFIVRGAFASIKSLQECWLGEKRVARKCGNTEEEVRWVWERKREDEDNCIMGGGSFAKLRMEKEAVVVRSEIGF